MSVTFVLRSLLEQSQKLNHTGSTVAKLKNITVRARFAIPLVALIRVRISVNYKYFAVLDLF
jgi:hypothetical protein